MDPLVNTGKFPMKLALGLKVAIHEGGRLDRWGVISFKSSGTWYAGATKIAGATTAEPFTPQHAAQLRRRIKAVAYGQNTDTDTVRRVQGYRHIKHKFNLEGYEPDAPPKPAVAYTPRKLTWAQNRAQQGYSPVGIAEFPPQPAQDREVDPELMATLSTNNQIIARVSQIMGKPIGLSTIRHWVETQGIEPLRGLGGGTRKLHYTPEQADLLLEIAEFLAEGNLYQRLKKKKKMKTFTLLTLLALANPGPSFAAFTPDPTKPPVITIGTGTR